LTGLFGCVSFVPRVPSRGGGVWQRLEGAHFVVLTNQGDEDALETLHELERFLASFTQFGWTAYTEHQHKVTAVVFENDVELHAFLPHRYGGMFTAHAPYAPLIVAYNGEGGFRGESIKHELAHYLASLSTPRQPAWFSEGLACYFETATTNIDNDEVSIGRPHEGLASVIGQEGILRASDLLAPQRDSHGRNFYPSAWLLMHYLMSQHQESLVAFHARLIEGDEASVAWASAFPALTPAALDIELEAYARRGRYQYAVRDIPLEERTPPLRSLLSDADVLAIRALLFALNPFDRRDPAKARTLALRDLDASSALDPLNALGVVVRMQIDIAPPDEAVEVATRLTQAHAEEWTAWMLLLDSLHRAQVDNARLDAAATEAIRHHPNNRSLLVVAVSSALEGGDVQRALDIARHAKKLHGGDSDVLLRYALALFAVGACDTARSAGQRALLRMPLAPTTEQYALNILGNADTACRRRTSSATTP